MPHSSAPGQLWLCPPHSQDRKLVSPGARLSGNDQTPLSPQPQPTLPISQMSKDDIFPTFITSSVPSAG